jgi:hypothetical protein
MLEKLIRISLLSFLITTVNSSFGQAVGHCKNVDRSSEAAVKKEVARVFNETLDGMEITIANGVKATTWMGWKPEDQEQIKCLGGSAVPFMVELLDSSRSFGQLLAVKMLGWAGGSEIVDPLMNVFRHSKSKTVKISALESLYSAPQAQAKPVLESIAKSNEDSKIRDMANQILARYSEAKDKSQ